MEVLLSGKTLSVLLQATVVLLHTVLLLTAGMCQVVIRLLGTRVVHNYCDIHVFSVNFCFWVASFLGLTFEIGMGLNFCFDSSFLQDDVSCNTGSSPYMENELLLLLL